MYSVYIHIFPNNKRYVGITNCKPEKRWGSNGCNYKNSYMSNAIKKYGWDNIKHEIIAENLTVEEASEMEIKLIDFYKTTDRKHGYNISLGGVSNYEIMSKETKEKLRKANIGKTMSEETKNKISKAMKGIKKSEQIRKNMSIAQKKSFANGNNAMHSKEAREKARLKLKGKKFSDEILLKATVSKYHSVINIETNIKYMSIKEASEKTGVDRTTIIRHCKNKCKNQKWIYAEII